MSNIIGKLDNRNSVNGSSRPLKPLLETFVSRIHRGELKDGDKLPPLRKFASEHGISVRSARSVFSELVRAGLVKSIQGDGTYVSTSSSDEDIFRVLCKEVHLVLQHRPYVPSGIIRLLINELQLRGYIVVVIVEHAPEQQKQEFTSLLEKRWSDRPPAAIVMEGRSERIDRLVKQHTHPFTKVIATFRHPTYIYSGWHSVQLDIAGAHYFATKRLLEQGHRDIAIAIKKHQEESEKSLFPERSQMVNSLCLSGASHAVEDNGVEAMVDTISFEKAKDLDDDSEPTELENQIIQNTARWLEEHDDVTAIVGQEPWLWYVKIAAGMLKKRIPEDLAVIGIGQANAAYKGEYPCLDWCYKQMATEVTKIITSDRKEMEQSTRHILLPSKWVDSANWQQVSNGSYVF